MKTFLTILMTLCITSCFAQKIQIADSFPKPFEFYTIDSTNADKDAVFVKANEWFVKMNNSVITYKLEMVDKEAGKIFSNVIMSATGFGTLKHLAEFSIKGNRYRLKLSEFVHEGGYNTGFKYVGFGPLNNDSTKLVPRGRSFDKFRSIVMQYANETIKDFEKHMQSDNDEW